MFQKSENFPKIWKFSKNLKIFWKSDNFSKIWKFSKNLKIFWKSDNFSKIWKFSENLKTFQKSENSQKSDIFFKNLEGGCLQCKIWIVETVWPDACRQLGDFWRLSNVTFLSRLPSSWQQRVAWCLIALSDLYNLTFASLLILYVWAINWKTQG